MPAALAVALFIALAISALAALGFFLYHALSFWSNTVQPTLGFRSPLFRKNDAEPNQWLLDVAQQDRENPAALVATFNHCLREHDLRPDIRRPYVIFGVTVFNGTVLPVQFDDLRGPVRYRGEPSEFEPEHDRGHSVRINRGQSFELRIKQYIPPTWFPTCTARLAKHQAGNPRARSTRSLSAT